MARGLSGNTQPQNEKTQFRMAAPTREAKPVRWSRVETLCSGVVFLVALLLYSWTLAPTVTLTDSGELIVVAHGLGVAHPPGVPLWIILAHLASLVPFGNVAQRINFSSALFAALACAMLALGGRRVNDYRLRFSSRRSERRRAQNRTRKPRTPA